MVVASVCMRSIYLGSVGGGAQNLWYGKCHNCVKIISRPPYVGVSIMNQNIFETFVSENNGGFLFFFFSRRPLLRQGRPIGI